MSDYAYIGKGTIKSKEYGSMDALASRGNASALNLAIALETKELPDFQNVGGGLDESLDRIQSVTAQMTLHNLSPENIAIATNGEAGAAESGVITIEMLVNSGLEYQLKFEGLNEAKSGRQFNVTLYRVKFSPATDFPLIGDDFAGLPVTAKVLRDDSIVGEGLSKYGKFELAEAA